MLLAGDGAGARDAQILAVRVRMGLGRKMSEVVTRREGRLRPIDEMRWTAWIWFAGAAAWLADGMVSVRLHSGPRAQLAFMVALVFLGAGFFYRSQRR